MNWRPEGRVIWKECATITILNEPMQIMHILKQQDSSSDLVLITMFRSGRFNKEWVLDWASWNDDDWVMEELMQRNVKALIDKVIEENV